MIPRYRNAAPHLISVGSMLIRAGDEFDFAGWPPLGKVEALNEPARRIIEYRTKLKNDPFCPASPRNDIAGGIFLPAVCELGASLRVVDPAPDGAPLYRATAETQCGHHRKVAEGETVAVLGWPSNHCLEPANEAAERVKAYYEENRDHPRLFSAPWCEYRRELVLPDLPATRKIFKRSEFGESAQLPDGGDWDRSTPARSKARPAPAPRAPRKSMRRSA